MKSDAGALIVIPDTNYSYCLDSRFRKASEIDASRHLIDRIEDFFHVDILLYDVIYRSTVAMSSAEGAVVKW